MARGLITSCFPSLGAMQRRSSLSRGTTRIWHHVSHFSNGHKGPLKPISASSEDLRASEPQKIPVGEGATLRLMQVLHRHGDRAPQFNVCATDSVLEEKERSIWADLLPKADRMHYLERRFPVHFDGHEEQNKDITEYPFGHCTELGVEQMQIVGEQLRAYLDAAGLEAADTEHVRVLSTGYRRTQLSAQSLLLGLFSQSEISVPVIVPPLLENILNPYDSKPEVGRRARQLEAEHPDFLRGEEEAEPLKRKLTSLLPMYREQPEKFRWIHGADYFTCREEHQLPFLPATESLKAETIRHFIWRFHQFYADDYLRQLAAGPIFQQLGTEVIEKISETEEGTPKKGLSLVVYSGHDVTLFALLSALNSSLTRAGGDWWPPYASILTLELLQRPRKDNSESSEWLIRTLVNFKPIYDDWTVNDCEALDDFLLRIGYVTKKTEEE